MRLTLLALTLASSLSLPAAAQTLSRDPDLIDQMRRQQSMQQQQDTQVRVQRAREKCVANRGVDCETIDGLQEWLLLDRSRADAVLDRIAPFPPGGSASTGSSSLPAR